MGGGKGYSNEQNPAQQPQQYVEEIHVAPMEHTMHDSVPLYMDPTVVVAFIGLLTAIVTGYFARKQVTSAVRTMKGKLSKGGKK